MRSPADRDAKFDIRMLYTLDWQRRCVCVSASSVVFQNMQIGCDAQRWAVIHQDDLVFEYMCVFSGRTS